MKKAHHLTAKEKQVCDLIVTGLTNKDIARNLNISDRTVEDYRKNIYRKFNIDEKGNKSVLLVRKFFHLDEVA